MDPFPTLSPPEAISYFHDSRTGCDTVIVYKPSFLREYQKLNTHTPSRDWWDIRARE